MKIVEIFAAAFGLLFGVFLLTQDDGSMGILVLCLGIFILLFEQPKGSPIRLRPFIRKFFPLRSKETEPTSPADIAEAPLQPDPVTRKEPAPMNGNQNGLHFQINSDSTASIVGYHGNASSLTIPDTYRGHKVTRIEAEVFKDCYDLSYVKIPASITYIGPNAFQDCGKREDEELSRACGAHSRRDLEYMFGYGYEAVESRLIGYQSGLYDGYFHVEVSVAKGSYAEAYCEKNNIRIIGYLY